MIDRELYLPQSWAQDRDRCRAAGIPEDVEFTTKPRQAQAMIGRAVAAGVPFAWFTADEAYGRAKYLQAWLEDQDVSYVMAIRRSDTLTTSTGEQRADALISAVSGRAWQECFQQAKGEAGLDHYQVRSWRAWYAHITLSMLALAWLSASRAEAVKRGSAPASRA